MFVSVCINTCDRPSCLWKLLVSLSCQTYTDFEVVIVDDGSEKCSENELVKSAVLSLEEKGIRVTIHDNPQVLGLAASRNVASDLASQDWIVKLDDDHYCDSACIEHLVDASYKKPHAGCIGMVFPLAQRGLSVSDTHTPIFGYPEIDREGWVTQQEKLYSQNVPDIIPTKMVRGLMLYRKVPEIRHDERLSPIGHREDSIFSMEYLRNGYENYVCVRAIAWHFQAPSGGCRRWGAEEAARLRTEDEKVWRQYLEETGQDI